MERFTDEDFGAGSWTRLAANDNIYFCAAIVAPEYLNAKGLSQYLGISEMTLHRWRKGYRDPHGKWHEPVAGFPQPSIGIGNPVQKLGSLLASCERRQFAFCQSRVIDEIIHCGGNTGFVLS